MARIFLSYRRADGRHAVGWIAERLSQQYDLTEGDTAFRDGELRCGDDFPTALEAELRCCDLLVAVIGPNWHGRSDDGNHRILDPNDWVAREISTAFRMDKLVLPVLVGGAEPLRTADLPPTLHKLTAKHAVAFENGEDLETLMRHLRYHLDDIDLTLAKKEGLEEPITLPPLHFGPKVVVLAMLAAAVGSALGWASLNAFAGGDEFAQMLLDKNGPLTAVVTVEFAMWSALWVLGVDYFRSHFRGDFRVDWGPVLLAYTLAALLLGWVILAFGASGPLRWDVERSWLLAIGPLALLAPWIITALGSAWTVPVIGDHQLGRRARALGELDRARGISVVVLAVAAAPGVLTAGTVDWTLRRCDCPVGSYESYQPHEVLAWGLFLSGLLAAAAVLSRARLRQLSVALAADLADEALAPRHRAHGEDQLIDERGELGSWWQVALIGLPFAVGIGVVILL